jgi:hypothetical protein
VFPVKVSLAACPFRYDQARERLVVSDQSHAIRCGDFDDFKLADPDHTNGAYTEWLKLLQNPEFANRRSYPHEEIEARIQENRDSWE